MTAAHTLRRSLIVSLGSLGLAVSLVGLASARSTGVPDEVVIVSSTELGVGSFTMTASNLGDSAVDLDLAAPGLVSDVEVDLGSFDGRWTINRLNPGEAATMTGLLEG